MRSLLMILGLIPIFVPTLLYLSNYQSDVKPDMWLFIMMAYGSILLAFLGGIQWGLSLQGRHCLYSNVLIPLWSSLIASTAFIVLLLSDIKIAFMVLMAGFLVQLLADLHFHRKGHYHKDYIVMRIIATTVIFSCFILVL